MTEIKDIIFGWNADQWIVAREYFKNKGKVFSIIPDSSYHIYDNICYHISGLTMHRAIIVRYFWQKNNLQEPNVK